MTEEKTKCWKYTDGSVEISKDTKAGDGYRSLKAIGTERLFFGQETGQSGDLGFKPIDFNSYNLIDNSANKKVLAKEAQIELKACLDNKRVKLSTPPPIPPGRNQKLLTQVLREV